MAWYNGKWLDRNERAEIIRALRAFKREADRLFPSIDDLEAADMLDDYAEKVGELVRLERIHRCETDLLAFSIEYFGNAGNPNNDGNWDGFDLGSPAEAARFHREICGDMDVVSNERTNAYIARAAPRSHGKSTYLSKAFPLREICFRKRKYVIIISETPAVSKANMQWIRDQLKMNKKLRDDFGALLSPRDQANIVDNSEEFIAWTAEADGSKKQLAILQAASTGQALRGRNWNGVRPDLIVCDDMEDAKSGGNASTPEQREKLRLWWSQTVMPLGDPSGKRTAFVVMGTTVHKEALLMQILYNRSDFDTRVYSAIISHPIREDLWEAARLIYIDKENPNRAKDARQFYEDNRAEMDEGAQVLWEDVQPLWKLMTWKWDNGSLAFNTEYMNNPVDEENMLFNPKTFTYHDGTIDARADQYEVSLGIDFAMGKARGDYSSICVVARDRVSGIYYVVDSFVERVKPDKFLRVIVDRVLYYQPTVIGVESQAAQEFFADQLQKELIKVGYPANTRLKKVYQRSRKELRIEAMMPAIENGTIRFNRRHALLLEQFEMYGTGAHDDALDALEIAKSSLPKYGEATVQTARTMNRW